MTTSTADRPLTKGIILVYVLGMIVANLTIAALGPVAVIPVGFLLIGLNLVVRDRIHDRLAEHGRAHLIGGLGVLIGVAGLASWWANPAAGPIAVASFVAFLTAATVDAAAYSYLGHKGLAPWARSAGSNVPAAAVDSATFLALAFPGPLPIALALIQTVAKVAGGTVWAWLVYVLPGKLDAAAAAQAHTLDVDDEAQRVIGRDYAARHHLGEWHDPDPTLDHHDEEDEEDEARRRGLVE